MNKGPLSIYSQKFRLFQNEKKKLAQLIEKSERSAREIEFLNFQLEEFNKAELIEGEQEKLEKEQSRLANAEDIKRTYGAAYNSMAEAEVNMVGQVQEIARSLQATRKISGELNEISERLEGILAEMQELAKDCERIAERTEFNPQRIAEVEDRLNVLFKLQKKHNVGDTAALLQLQDELEQQTGGFTDLGAAIAALEKQIAQQETQLRKAAAEMGKRRRGVVAGFESKVRIIG